MTTYGEYQEDVATALSALVSRGELPVDPARITNMLHARDILIDDVHQRLELLGVQRSDTGRHSPQAAARSDAGRYRGPLGVLANAVDQLPRSQDRFMSEGPSPLETLSADPTDPTGQWWRDAAASHLLATHELTAPAHRNQLLEDGSRWHLLGDCASVVEAVTILDHDLSEAGLISPGLPSSQVDQIRSEVSYLAKTAAWYRANPSIDYATTGTGRETPEGVLIVSSPTDLAQAQRRLASYVRPLHGSNFSYGDAAHTTPRITASETLRLVRNEGAVLGLCAHAARQTPGAENEAKGLSELSAQLTDLVPEIKMLRDIQPAPPRVHLVRQIEEIHSRTRAMTGNGKLQSMSPNEWRELLHASRDAAAKTAHALRVEATRQQSNLLRVVPGEAADRHRKGGHLDRKLGRFISQHQQPDRLPPWTPDQGVHRAALRTTLDATPTSRPPQYPSPRGRDSYGR